jgi:hypothetical protein
MELSGSSAVMRYNLVRQNFPHRPGEIISRRTDVEVPEVRSGGQLTAPNDTSSVYCSRSRTLVISRRGMDDATLESWMEAALVRSHFPLHSIIPGRIGLITRFARRLAAVHGRRKCSTDGRRHGSLDGKSGGTQAQTGEMMNCCPRCLKIQCFRGHIVAASPLGQGWRRPIERRSSVARSSSRCGG